jgi:predicted dehydrogenase
MGRRHIQASRLAGLEVVGVYDISGEALKLAKNEHGLDSAILFTNLDDLYRETSPECVIVASTADSHCELTCMAAERGARYVLVEKPMATSLEQCDRMIETCAVRGVRLAVNHQMRFMEQYIEARCLLASPEYGGMASMNIVAGNIGFSMNACHYFEAFRYVAGAPVTEVAAWFSPGGVPNPRGPQFEDRAGSIRAVTADGKRLYIEMGADQGHGVRSIYAARYGIVSIDELTGAMSAAVREAQYRELPTTRYGMPAQETQLTIRAAEVIDTTAAVIKALLSDEDNVSGEDGRRAVEVLVAAYQSAEAGGAQVRLDSLLDRRRIFPWA